MSPSEPQLHEQIPNCPKCDSPMVKRTAKRGANAGSEFWGCSEFPRCRSIVPYEAAEAPAIEVPPTSTPRGGTREVSRVPTDPSPADEPEGFLTKVARTVDKGWRWYLESDEPDASGRWDEAHRRRMLSYIHNRDGGRCGLCAGEMKLKGAQIEHVVPKVFAVFDVRKGGKAEPGTRYTSRLHKTDNLQAAHTYCNKRKGNTPDVAKWRHPAMPPISVADADDGTTFVLPWRRRI